MLKFKFEIIQTVEGLPDPAAYPEGLSHNPKLSGAARVVIEEFEDEEEAKRQECYDEEARHSEIWLKYCPSEFQSITSLGGLDVYYIGPASEKDVKKFEEAVLEHTL